MKANLNTARITPKKINLVSDMVRTKGVVESMDILKFTPKKGARILLKLLKSALSNAENNFKQEKDNLYIKEITVTKGPTLKRSVPISRGRVHPILKRNAHITILLSVKEVLENKKTEKKGVKKEEVTVTTENIEKNDDKKTVKKTAKSAVAKKTSKSTKA